MKYNLILFILAISFTSTYGVITRTLIHTDEENLEEYTDHDNHITARMTKEDGTFGIIACYEPHVRIYLPEYHQHIFWDLRSIYHNKMNAYSETSLQSIIKAKAEWDSQDDAKEDKIGSDAEIYVSFTRIENDEEDLIEYIDHTNHIIVRCAYDFDRGVYPRHAIYIPDFKNADKSIFFTKVRGEIFSQIVALYEKRINKYSEKVLQAIEEVKAKYPIQKSESNLSIADDIGGAGPA